MDITQGDYETLAQFRYALRYFLRFSEDAAAAMGLSPQQHQALLAIKGWGGDHGVTIGTLAERLQIRHHSTVGLVDRLETNELVCRIHDSVDHRRVYVRLTDAGADLLARITEAHRGELDEVGPKLITLLQELLEKRPAKD